MLYTYLLSVHDCMYTCTCTCMCVSVSLVCVCVCVYMQTLSKFLIEDSHDIITHSVVYTCLLIYCVLLILLCHLCVT